MPLKSKSPVLSNLVLPQLFVNESEKVFRKLDQSTTHQLRKLSLCDYCHSSDDKFVRARGNSEPSTTKDDLVTEELQVLDTSFSSTDTIHFEDEMQTLPLSKEDVNNEDADDGFHEISLGSNLSEVGSQNCVIDTFHSIFFL